jgi:hypothetical protein
VARPQQRNPLYLLLLVVGLAFAVTAFACALLPVLEQKAIDAGEQPPPSAFRDALRENGWRWLLWELAVLIVVGVASMVWDHLRGLESNAPPGTISPSVSVNDKPPLTPVSHGPQDHPRQEPGPEGS